MIDVNTETLLPFNKARAHPVFLTDGKRCSLQKLYRLAMQGAKATNGARIRLEVVKLPTGLVTSAEAVQRFVTLLTDPEADTSVPTPVTRRRQIDRAVADLEAEGFEIGQPA